MEYCSNKLCVIEWSITSDEGGNEFKRTVGILTTLLPRQMSTSQAPVDQSIARAFINFLEEESSVRIPPTLPVVEMARAKTDQVGDSRTISFLISLI